MQEVVAAVIKKDGLILVAQRKSGSLAGKWEFPGGKVRKAETREAALIREIQEELGATVLVGPLITEVPISKAEEELRLLGYYASHLSGEFSPVEHAGIRWVKPSQLLSLDLCPADVPLAKQVAEENK